MVGMKPTDVVPSAAVKFFGAGTAACIADLITFPLDTAKVRLQVRHTRCLWWPQILQHRVRHSVSLWTCQIQGESQKVKGEGTLKYRGVMGTITTMVRTEGPRSLYNGLVAGLQRQMSFASVRIGLYDSMKQFYTRGTDSEHQRGALYDMLSEHSLSQRLICCVLHRRRDCDPAHGGLHYRCHGCGFCTTHRCGEGAISGSGATVWRRKEVQRHLGRLQDHRQRRRHTWPLERCSFTLL